MSTTVRFYRLIGFLMAILATLQGCGVSQDKGKAETAMEIFHRQLDAGDFDAIWNGADEELRAATSQAKFDKFVQAVHGKLGRVVKTSRNGWRAQTFNFKTSFVLRQKTEFEHGSGMETFTYAIHGEEVKLLGYHIESDDLFTL